MDYTVAYPKKFKWGGGQEYTLVLLPGNNFFYGRPFLSCGSLLDIFLYYAIMGTMRGLFLHVGGGAFLSLVGTLLGLPPPCDRTWGEKLSSSKNNKNISFNSKI